MSARLFGGALAPACAALAAGCTAPTTYEDVPTDRSWFSVFLAGIDRRGADEDLVSDGTALAIEGGYDFVKSGAFRTGLELGAVWSNHDVDQVTGPDSSPSLGAVRWDFGLRAAIDFRPTNALVYVNGGLYVRDEDSHAEPQLEQDGLGAYFGAGFDFWFDPTGRMGPFVRVYDFSDSDLSEVLVGLSVSFDF